MGEAVKPVLQKPPGYRDLSVPAAAARPPPKKPQLRPAFQNAGKPSRRGRSGRSCCCRLCCCLIVLLIVIAALSAAAAGFTYLWFRPHLPTFRIENVTVPVFRITSRSDATFLDATATVKILAANPNKKLGLSFRDSEGRVALADEDGEVDLGAGSAAGFELDKKNLTAVKITAVAKGVMVDDSVGARLKARFKSKKIGFMMEMRSKLGFIVDGKPTPKFSIRVKCGSVTLKQIGSARPQLKCDIKFFNGLF